LSDALRDLPIEWTVAQTRDAGVDLLRTSCFDLVLCDLKMPRDVVSSELAIEHGIDAATQVRAVAPGTPLLIYSGFRKEAEFESLVANAHPADLYGAGEVDMVRSFDKTKPDLLYAAIRGHCAGLMALSNSVEILPGGQTPPGLGEYDSRIVRIYARSRGGTL